MSYVSTAYLSRCFRVYDVCVTYVRRIEPATYVLRIFKCTHKNMAHRRMRSMSYVSRSMSYVCSGMYDVRVTYLSYLDTPWIRESRRNGVTAVIRLNDLHYFKYGNVRENIAANSMPHELKVLAYINKHMNTRSRIQNLENRRYAKQKLRD